MVLYRKYRPKTFDEIYGQGHIVQTLRNEIINNRVPNALLLYGTRGSGKTTIARIFAKAINCKNPINGNPCCKCEYCNAIENKTVTDIVEIDAASNNSVDNIRALIDECRFQNVLLKYKVYIIDEVHMLSASAYNALLKTLEEPPSHVKFILATTDPQKISDTIKSRCQRFQFHLLKSEEIKNMIYDICKKENKTIDENSINIIIKHASGSMRDALTLLEEVILYNTDNNIKELETINVLGIPEDAITNKLVTCLYKKELVHSLNCLSELRNNGVLLNNIAYSLYDNFKDMYLSNYDTKIILILERLSKLLGTLNNTSNGYTEFEIAIIQICMIDNINLEISNNITDNKNGRDDKINDIISDTISDIDLDNCIKLKYNLDRIPKIKIIRG